jgi:Fe-S-cluster containining protein
MKNVPCNGCTACCNTALTVKLKPQEWDAFLLKLPLYQGMDPQLVTGYYLAHVDGRCAYVGPSGCTVHENKPRMCSDYDGGETVDDKWSDRFPELYAAAQERRKRNPAA